MNEIREFQSINTNGQIENIRGETSEDLLLRDTLARNPYAEQRNYGFFWSRSSATMPHDFWDDVPADAHILCVKYSETPFDIQVGITGTFKSQEEDGAGARREIEEELGLSPTDYGVDVGFNRSHKWFWCMGDAALFEAAIAVPSVDHIQDDRGNKLGVLLYTVEPNLLLEVLAESHGQGGFNQLDADDIDAIVLVPKAVAHEMTYQLLVRQNLSSGYSQRGSRGRGRRRGRGGGRGRGGR